MPPIEYESFTESYLQCGGYYVDALLDAKNFPNFEIPHPDALFTEACSLLSRYSLISLSQHHLIFLKHFYFRVEQLGHKISVLKLILMLFNKFPLLSKQPIPQAFEAFDRWIHDLAQLQLVGDEACLIRVG